MKTFRHYLRSYAAEPFVFLSIARQNRNLTEWLDKATPSTNGNPFDFSNAPRSPGYEGIWSDDNAEHAKLMNELHRHLTTSHAKWANSLNSDEILSLNSYTGTSSHPINMTLIHGHQMGHYPTEHDHELFSQLHRSYSGSGISHQKAQEFVHIKTALNKAPPLEHDMEVYSGVGNGFNLEQLKKLGGGTIRLPAFTSASIHQGVASSFAREKWADGADGPHQEVIRFHLPKGSRHGGYLEGRVSGLQEYEYLINSNKKIQLIGQPKQILYHGVSDKFPRRMLVHDAEIVE